jgi:hypothetical protein
MCLGLAQPREAGASAADSASERHFELLNVGQLAFTNVWVHRQTNFNILIRHSGGIHTIKLTDLPANELAELKSQIGDLAALEKPAGSPAANGLLEKFKTALQKASPRTLAIAGSGAVLLTGLVIVARRRGQSAPPA